MNDNEREMDLALAEAEQENRLLRARNERLERELAGQVALDKMAENARELGLDYEPAPVQEKCFLCGERVASCTSDVCPKLAQPAVIQQMVDALDHADELLGGNDTLVMNGAAAGRWLLEQPAVQEPVARQYQGRDGVWRDFINEKHYKDTLEDGSWPIRNLYTTPPAQPAVQEGRDWSLLEATQESLREHMAEIKRLKATQPAPVQDLPFGVGGGLVAIKTLLSRDPCVHANTAIEMIDAILKEHPVAPKPWVGLTDGEMHECAGEYPWTPTGLKCARAIEAKLKEKNT
jgi:hypothetical protein